MPSVFTPSPTNAAALQARLGSPILVVGLCAAWCDTCREFESSFERLAQTYSHMTFIWLDIEDDSALAGDIEIEDFPTLAVFKEGQPVYFGTTLPQEGVVKRLLLALEENSPKTVAVPIEVAELPSALLRYVKNGAESP